MIKVIGGGLAGSEAAWQIAQRGIKVSLYEMRPHLFTPAHHTALLAELVCSNSLRANSWENAVGILKEEMRRLGSLIMNCADKHALPAGGALAVDREAFSAEVTQVISEHPLIEIVRQEVKEIPAGLTVLASGPLTSELLTAALQKLTGEDFLYFYDAAAPLVEADSIDMTKVFWASRYDKGEADYLNCPMNEAEYSLFYEELITARRYQLHEFEKEGFFEGCIPVEVMAARGRQTLLFGPLKPIGLAGPASLGKKPYAVVQLRRDNAAATLFNMVGFQTNLEWGEQKRVFRLIPGLHQAEFARLGVMHRNTFINAPKLLLPTAQVKTRTDLFIAGQLSGVEGYVESAASGLLAGINAARQYCGQNTVCAPRESALGSLLYYITHAKPENFQPMNITFGLIPVCEEKIWDKKKKKQWIALRALESIERFRRFIAG